MASGRDQSQDRPLPSTQVHAEITPATSEGRADQGPDDDLPVVARLVVEIRSDGSRTVARGALEELGSGQRVAVEAHGGSPLSLALELAKAIFSTRKLAGQVARRLLPGGRKR